MRKVGTIIDSLKKGEEAPDRHQNPYLKEALGLEKYLLTQNELKNNFLKLYEGQTRPLVVEIGCYMGKTVLELAQKNPQTNFLGLDITYKRVVKSARKLNKTNCDNARIAISDGRYFLNEIVPDCFLDGVCIFFPDPWPKDRHEKNRILNESFILQLKDKLKNNGFFWFKTDHESYFKTTEEFLLQYGFVADDHKDGNPLLKPNKINGEMYVTAFQKLFCEKGIPFYQRVYLNNK